MGSFPFAASRIGRFHGTGNAALALAHAVAHSGGPLLLLLRLART